MTYVPIVTPSTTPQPPSPRTRELAGLLTKVLEEYQNAHPSVSRSEVRAALRLAQLSTGGDKAPVALVVSLTLGLLVAGVGLGLLFFMRGGGEIEMTSSLPMVIMAIAIFLGIVMVLVKGLSR
jgi:hypothetical protein